MKRWLVVFESHPAPSDATLVDVRARCELEAIGKARREAPPQHPWHIASARPWPRGCGDVDAAVKRMVAGERS